jgi:hypothetical protein
MPCPETLCVYQFKVVLRGISPMIWRRLLWVPFPFPIPGFKWEFNEIRGFLHIPAKTPSIDLQAVEILAFADALLLFDPDFTDMDPDSVEHRAANLSRERPQLVKTMKKESPAVSISSPSLKWPKISRITAWCR